MSSAPDFNILDPNLENGLVVEASAGTGKTFSVAAVVAREIALNDDLRMSNVLVTTFTRNAAAELRDRIRRQLVTLEEQLRPGAPTDNDPLANSLRVHDDALLFGPRLARAIREFDTSTISTIHSVCSRILALAGLEMSGDEAETDIESLVKEVVNDKLINEKLLGYSWKEKPFTDAVTESLRSPRSELAFLPYTAKNSLAKNAELEHLQTSIAETVDEVRRRSGRTPTFDDLLLRTAELLADSSYASVVAAFRERFRIAIIDEAQDTDALQWEIFRAVFSPDETTRQLIAVGDPKQAIYRFRGADVEAYLAARDLTKVRTLRRNFRSDAGLIDALNHVFDGTSFGTDINYVKVSARESASFSTLQNAKPLTLIDLDEATTQFRVVGPAARRVRQILEEVRIEVDAEGVVPGTYRAVVPNDICVLVNNKGIGRAIETALRRMGVAAVSAGTGSVMEGNMATAFRRLFEAMHAPYLESAIRLVAATPLFGDSLADAGVLDDQRIEEVQSTVTDWSHTLRRRGVAALASKLRADRGVLARIVRGPEGERHETDFAHVVELLHQETNGTGCTPAQVIDAFDRLAARDELSDTVSRRVESDREAVQIMTTHASKGLEFPIVVVADLWKFKQPRRGAATFHRESPVDGSHERVIDVGLVMDRKMDESARKSEEYAEKMRLFYVAMTRARHHVSLVVSRSDDARTTDGIISRASDENAKNTIEVIPVQKIPYLDRYQPTTATTGTLRTADGPTREIEQTYQRLSFTGITSAVKGRQPNAVDLNKKSGGGHHDDDEPILTGGTKYSSDDSPLGVPAMPLARLVGGTYFGKVMHTLYEHIDFTAVDLHNEVSRVVNQFVTGSALREHLPALIDGIVLSLRTPLGGPLADLQLSQISPENRLAELTFEMTLAQLDDNVRASDIGRLLINMLPSDDILLPYAHELSQSIFDIPLLGLMNGSIDALLNVNESNDAPRLFITDYKSNRLDREGDTQVIDGYTRGRMFEEMRHHHYPLQALIYGASVYRYLRWRRPNLDADAAIGGIAYFFIRGMVGADTPVVDGHRHGVFTWAPPTGLWSALSDLLVGVRA